MELVVDTEEAAEPALEAGPDPVDRETVEETGFVLVVDGAGFETGPDADDAGLGASLDDGTAFVLSAVVVVILLGPMLGVGLVKVFFGISNVDEGVARIPDPLLLLESDFPFPKAIDF